VDYGDGLQRHGYMLDARCCRIGVVSVYMQYNCVYYCDTYLGLNPGFMFRRAGCCIIYGMGMGLIN
jgi:hypothetical protein